MEFLAAVLESSEALALLRAVEVRHDGALVGLMPLCAEGRAARATQG